MSCGGSVSVSLYCMDGATLKKYAVRDIITAQPRSWVPRLRTVKQAVDQTPEESFLAFTEGYKLFKGKIVDVLRETRGAFNFGRVVLSGISEYQGQNADVVFQNENLVATVDGKILATTPDLICIVDTETFTPITTDALKYGKRVMVIGLKCFDMWRTEKGLELVGPRYFGCDTDYIAIEVRCR